MEEIRDSTIESISKIAKRKFKLDYVIWFITKKNPFKKESKVKVEKRINFLKKITRKDKSIKIEFLENKINLGLDLQGGSYLLLEVESEILFKEELENFSDTIRLLSRENKVKINDINANNDNLFIRFASSEKLEIIRKKFLENYRDVNVSINNNSLLLK